MPDASFLESYPLYRKFDFEVPNLLTEFRSPAIHLTCQSCGIITTFNTALRESTSDYWECYEWARGGASTIYQNGTTAKNAYGKVVCVVYECAACRGTSDTTSS